MNGYYYLRNENRREVEEERDRFDRTAAAFGVRERFVFRGRVFLTRGEVSMYVQHGLGRARSRRVESWETVEHRLLGSDDKVLGRRWLPVSDFRRTVRS